MKKELFKIILLCTFFLFACENKKPTINPKPKHPNAGVVITFDDTSVDEWDQADKILRLYSWKATFCVSKINTLTYPEITKLQKLQQEGHEIAGHGYNHFKAPDYVAENGIDKYIDQEINPMLDLMHFYSLKVTSFAYPYGFRNAEIDSALLKKFKIVRGTTYGTEAPFFQYCYFNNSRSVLAIGIDTDYPNFNIPYLLKLLEFAKRKNKILILYGHKPVDNITANYQTETSTLQLICNYVQQHKMTFYHLSDLDNLN